MASPAISVIIPLYNAEKYLSDCLDSLLDQTFSDFEIIVVDDCSTDNSVAIVESYAPKFNGRLILTATKKNSGNAGYTARNKGFLFSRGEYVFFMDADDMIIETALEELYKAAKNYDADVVYTSTRYLFTSNGKVELMFDSIGCYLKEKGIENKLTLSLNTYENSVDRIVTVKNIFTAPWTKFVRRDFLLKNEIVFPEIKVAGDVIWTIALFVCSERLLRIPNAVYFWRQDSLESVTHKKRDVEKQICLWCSNFVSGMNSIDKLFKQTKLFQSNLAYRYDVLEMFFHSCFRHTVEARFQVESKEVYEILQREFENDVVFSLMIPFLFSVIDAQQKNLLVNQQQSNQYVEQTQAHIAKLEQCDKLNKAYIAELEKFIFDSQGHITELENEVKRLKG